MRSDAAAAPAKPAKTAKTVGAGAVPKREDSFSAAPCLFNSEEAAGEAIIDTVASRAVIGEDRVKGLVDSLPEDPRRMYIGRVTFKSGNSSKLASRYKI